MDILSNLPKLLYLADRECLAEEGMTITGDRMSALPQGPVLSTVMKLFSGKDSQSDVWNLTMQAGDTFLIPDHHGITHLPERRYFPISFSTRCYRLNCKPRILRKTK